MGRGTGEAANRCIMGPVPSWLPGLQGTGRLCGPANSHINPGSHLSRSGQDLLGVGARESWCLWPQSAEENPEPPPPLYQRKQQLLILLKDGFLARREGGGFGHQPWVGGPGCRPRSVPVCGVTVEVSPSRWQPVMCDLRGRLLGGGLCRSAHDPKPRKRRTASPHPILGSSRVAPQRQQSPPGGSSAQGPLTHLLEPQVGLHDLVDLVLEGDQSGRMNTNTRLVLGKALPEGLHPTPWLAAPALTTFTS